MLIVLIGYRGTGKTTVAQLVAASLAAPWWDADLEIERQAGSTIKEIFADDGEEGFRQLEQQQIAALTANQDGVLAVGGGAVLREANRRAMSRGTVFWLTADADTIFARINADPASHERRPKLTVHSGIVEIETLLAAREPLYRECADHCIQTSSKSPAQVAAEIVAIVAEIPPLPPAAAD